MSKTASIVKDMDDATYHSLRSLSSTGARKLLVSPATYRWWSAHPQEPRAEFDLGHAVHGKVLGAGLQIEIYPEEILGANGAVSTNAAKQWALDVRAEGRVPVKRQVANQVNAIVESVLANETARHLFESGDSEVSVFAVDPDTGVEVRARFDKLNTRGVDLKTTSGSASESGFAKSVFAYGYEVQYGHYLDTYRFATGDDLEMLFVAVEIEPPYLVGVHVLDDDAKKMGRDKARIAREIYARCAETGKWPGYTHRTRQPIGLIRPPMGAVYDYQDLMEREAS